MSTICRQRRDLFFIHRICKKEILWYNVISFELRKDQKNHMALIDTATQQAITQTTGLGTTAPTSVVTSIVSWMLGILAVIAVVLVIFAGIQWMTSGGNEEKVTAAKNLLRAALIGLVIILAAYGIALYVFRILSNVTGTRLS